MQQRKSFILFFYYLFFQNHHFWAELINVRTGIHDIIYCHKIYIVTYVIETGTFSFPFRDVMRGFLLRNPFLSLFSGCFK